MTTPKEPQAHIWVVFNADGCECKNFDTAFATQKQAKARSAILQREADTEYNEWVKRHPELFGGIRRIITVEKVPLGL